MLVSPSDHVIKDVEWFKSTVEAAIPTAEEGQIITFGIRADRAETGYGWLELSSKMSDGFAAVTQPLSSFVEKPKPEAAEALLKGRHALMECRSLSLLNIKYFDVVRAVCASNAC